MRLTSAAWRKGSPGATVHTDGWTAYLSLPEHGYEHDRTVMSAQPDPAHVVMPGVHRIASLLKRWLLGTHQGNASPEHLDAYLNELTFRFNRRHSRQRGLLCNRLLQQAILTEPVTYRQPLADPHPRERPQALHLRRRGRAPSAPNADRPWRRRQLTAWPQQNGYPV